MKGRTAAALAVVAVLVVGGGLVLRSLASTSSGDTAPVLDATCRVLALADRGEVEAAEDVFLDQVHEPIHDLARRASEADHRSEAARLLEAKNAIESSATGPTSAAAQQLVAATRSTLRTLGEPASPCPAP